MHEQVIEKSREDTSIDLQGRYKYTYIESSKQNKNFNIKYS